MGMVTIIAVGLLVLGLALLYLVLPGVSRNDFLMGVFIGMVGLIAVGLAVLYFTHDSLRLDPPDTGTSVETPPP